jgi:hypothetical protein
MRCETCNKFVSYDEGNTENITVELDEDCGAVEISGEVVLPCAECGLDLASCALEDVVEAGFEKSVLETIKEKVGGKYGADITEEWLEKNGAVNYEWADGEAPEVEFNERIETTKKVPIKKKGEIVGYKMKTLSARYAKTYKGVCVTGTLRRIITWHDSNLLDMPSGPVTDDLPFEHVCEEPASSFEAM